MRWLYIIDPIGKLNHDTDTTLALMHESCRRKIDTYIATIQDLSFSKKVCAKVQQIKFNGKGHALSSETIRDVTFFDLVLMRKEPPVDYAYQYATRLLSSSKTRVVNDASALRDINEKLVILNFPELIPKTIVTSEVDDIIEFAKSLKKYIIIKSLDSYQGRMVYRAELHDSKIRELALKLTHAQKIPVMAQEYIPGIARGDKRVLLLGTKVIGAVNRIPKPGSFLSNFAQGGTGVKTKITARDLRIANVVSKFLIKQGIHFAGLDIIGGRLSEINITCPTGVRQVDALENRKLEGEIVEYFIRLSEQKTRG